MSYYLNARIHMAQMNNQHTDDISQYQATGISHEQLVTAFSIAENIVKPERYYYP